MNVRLLAGRVGVRVFSKCEGAGCVWVCSVNVRVLGVRVGVRVFGECEGLGEYECAWLL